MLSDQYAVGDKVKVYSVNIPSMHTFEIQGVVSGFMPSLMRMAREIGIESVVMVDTGHGIMYVHPKQIEKV